VRDWGGTLTEPTITQKARRNQEREREREREKEKEKREKRRDRERLEYERVARKIRINHRNRYSDFRKTEPGGDKFGTVFHH